MIGSLGSIAFETSSDSVFTFNNLSFSRSANFAEHKILNGSSLLEYTGSNAATCSLDIELNSNMGIDPSKELENLREIFNSHEKNNLVLGSKIQGEFVIESMTEKHNIINNNGNIISVSVTLNLKEDGNEEN